MIRDLRREMTTTLGKPFDLREFHEAVLRDGPIPLDQRQPRVRACDAVRGR